MYEKEKYAIKKNDICIFLKTDTEFSTNIISGFLKSNMSLKYRV